MSPRRLPLLFLVVLGAVCAGRADGAAAQVWDPADCLPCAHDSLVAAGDTAQALRVLRERVAGAGDPRAGGELGLLLARQLTMLPSDIPGRAEAESLLVQALRAEPQRSHWALGYGLIRWKKGDDEEALAWIEGALAASASGGGLEPTLLAELHAARGSIFERTILERENPASPEALVIGRRPCPEAGDECFMEDMEVSLRRLREAPRSDSPAEVRAAMRRHLMAAFNLDPRAHIGTRTLLADLARTGEWDTFVELARQYVDATDGGGWPLAFLAAGLWRAGDAAGADAAFQAALEAVRDPARAVLENVSQSVHPDNERKYLDADQQVRDVWSRFLLRNADPLFLTPINERQLEHFTRVALAAQPSTYDFRADPLPHQVVRFQGETPERIELAVFGLLPPGPANAELPARAGLFFLPRTPAEELASVVSPVRIGGVAEPRIVTFRVPTVEGSYTYTIEATTDDGTIRSRARGTLEAASFLDRRPAMSDLLVARHIADPGDAPARGRRDLRIIPSADMRFDGAASVWVYFEVYGLAQDAGGAAAYRVALDVQDGAGRGIVARVLGRIAGAFGRERRSGTDQITWERAITLAAPRVPDWFEIRLEGGEPGTGRMTITVTDLVSGGTTSAQRSFAVAGESGCEILPAMQ